MTGLRILLTNRTLADRRGSELYVRDVARALLLRGHHPVVYSPILGEVVEDLRVATVPWIDNLDNMSEPPDIIHGQHHLETMTAMLHFPGVPGIYVCHGWLPWEEAPPIFPRIVRYVAVDHVTRDRLVEQHGIPADDVDVVLNFVDLDRFEPRGPLPERPRRALLFSNEDGPHVAIIRDACARSRITLDMMGWAFGNASSTPETQLGQYDLVFGRGRSALEALGVGCAVILISGVGLGPLVTAADLDRLRTLNLGIRTLSDRLTIRGLGDRIAAYDAQDAAEVSRRVRAEASLDATVDRLLEIYRGVLARPSTPASAADESRAAARYLRSLAVAFKWTTLERVSMQTRLDEANAAIERFRAGDPLV